MICINVSILYRQLIMDKDVECSIKNIILKYFNAFYHVIDYF